MFWVKQVRVLLLKRFFLGFLYTYHALGLHLRYYYGLTVHLNEMLVVAKGQAISILNSVFANFEDR